jgi:hypothetical protein
MRTHLAPLVVFSFAACVLVGCSRSSDETPMPDPADSVEASPPAATQPEAQAGFVPDAGAQGAATISFNASQTADSDAWYTMVEGSAACSAASSPSEATERLHTLGITPTTVDANAADGGLLAVVVSWSDERGQQTTTYYRQRGDCEAALPSAEPIPDKYK